MCWLYLADTPLLYCKRGQGQLISALDIQRHKHRQYIFYEDLDGWATGGGSLLKLKVRKVSPQGVAVPHML